MTVTAVVEEQRSSEDKGASGRRCCPFLTVGGENLAGEGGHLW